MPISEEQLVGLTKQQFMLEYLLNGLFPCQSDVVRLIRAKKREWKFSDRFEYRMLLATTNTGGTLNSQVYQQNVQLVKPGSLTYNTFQATYGSVTDGFDVDMMLNLETKEKQAAFENDYATRMHSLRTNVASLFKNFAIHGQFGVLHQIRSSITAPTIDTAYNPVANVHTVASMGTATAPIPFTIKVPINVFQSNFKEGKYLIKTSDTTVTGPWDNANVAELYMILDNQPGLLTLISVGTAMSAWTDGQFLEVAQNREIAQNSDVWRNGWTGGTYTVNLDAGAAGSAFNGTVIDKFAGTGAYTAGNNAVVGAMEGLADLFPWYTAGEGAVARLGLGRPFRGQPNRQHYVTEQAGGFIMQRANEHIIDAIMRGAFLTKSTVPYADVGVWMNPVTRIQMGYEEGDNVRSLRDNFVAGPIVYQRGVTTTDYQIGNQVVKEVVEDLNMPTDVIVIGPQNDMSYNCWDNTIFQIDDYIQETWSKKEPPAIEDIAIPDEFLTKLDISNRITFGAPSLNDGDLSSGLQGWRSSAFTIRHPKNSMPVALHEMGALFTEYPYCYTVVKLREPIADIITV
jgi:hypothetical protein